MADLIEPAHHRPTEPTATAAAAEIIWAIALIRWRITFHTIEMP
ncbi:hypothetical protein [Microcoleus sp. A6-C5]